MIGEQLRTILIEDAAVSAITTTVHPSNDPQSHPYPKITYENTSKASEISNDGVHLKRFNYQIDCWCKNEASKEALAEAVYDALQLYEDDDIQKIIVTDSFDNAVSRDEGKEKQTLFRKTITVTIST